MKDVDLAYCAGVIDSDGTIGIKRSTYAMRVTKSCEQPTFSERICVKQVEPHAVQLLKELFGGSFYMTKPTAARGRHLYTWQVTDRRAHTALVALLPFLRIKAEQARNCLALRDLKDLSVLQRIAKGRGHIGAARRPVEISIAMESRYEQARSLNRVGVA